jgi:DNA repair exonuclease SbcCD ATPase subunit
MSSLSNQGDDNMMSLWQKMKDTAEQLEEARHHYQELETQLQEVREQLEDSKEKARLASAAIEQLEVGLQCSQEFLGIVWHIGGREVFYVVTLPVANIVYFWWHMSEI